jgi:hypothetical protein
VRPLLLVAGFLILIASLKPLPTASATPFNILYYGNSFMSYGLLNIPTLVSEIAVAAGHEAPNFVNASVDGIGLGTHLAWNTAVISSGLPPTKTWDFVVMQNYSTAPTHIGDIAQHRADALGLYKAVASHSPSVVPVLFETWARGIGHEFYTGPTPDFPGGPAEMQQELRTSYMLAGDDIDAAIGDSLTRIAHAGSAFENMGFDPELYDEEGYHASDKGYLLSALVVYATIYGTPGINKIDLSGILSQLGLTKADGAALTATAITVAPIPEPSSWLLLATAVGTLAAWGWRRRR